MIVALSALLSSNARKPTAGVVTAATPEASEAGAFILRKGGNAIDAAIAVAFALAVTESPMSGLGGGTQILLSLKHHTPFAINGSTMSPAATPVDALDTLTYHRRSTIPSTVKVLEYTWRRYGSGKVAWAELVAPAIRLAKEGFAVGAFRAKVYAQYAAVLQKSPYHTQFFFTEQGHIPTEGDWVKQPVLAQTLEAIASKGADEFYRGRIAKQIAEDMARNGGWITYDDLSHFPDPVEHHALNTQAGSYALYSQPPPCGGWTMLMAHRLMHPPYADSLSVSAIVKALYLAHLDRKLRPITNLRDYGRDIAVKFSPAYLDSLYFTNLASEEDASKGGETTHFSVVDEYGNAVAVTASINAYFGAAAASPELGFLYNTYMDDFEFGQPGHPFAIRPHAQAYSSMSPTIVQQKGRNVLVLGSPGSSRIISSVAQITSQWMEEQDIVKQVAANRVHVNGQKIYLETLRIP
ncbi:MAG: gamma-glutamyltransferase [Saprospiraceae bacterium]